MKRAQGILILLLLISSFFIIYLIYERSSYSLLSTIENVRTDDNLQDEYKAIDTLKDVNTQVYNYEKKLDYTSIVYEDGKKRCFLKDVVKNKCLVIRLEQTNCQPCVNSLMYLLQQQNIRSAIVLANYDNEQFMLDLKRYHLKYRCFKTGSLPVSTDSLYVPYLFILDKELNIDNLFIPDKRAMKQTKQYLENVKAIVTP